MPPDPVVAYATRAEPPWRKLAIGMGASRPAANEAAVIAQLSPSQDVGLELRVMSGALNFRYDTQAG